jgi:hypothetical protein
MWPSNYLFCDSHGDGGAGSPLCGLTRTCAQYGIPPLPYLTDVLRKLAGNGPPSRLEELLPDRGQTPPANQP